ncbi:hypothetical protein [Paenibacillus chitinolyticus]
MIWLRKERAAQRPLAPLFEMDDREFAPANLGSLFPKEATDDRGSRSFLQPAQVIKRRPGFLLFSSNLRGISLQWIVFLD